MNNPRVSVIVPCYGVEKYLDRCMESLVNQTLKDIEIILVDDVSPDRVPEMCDEWAKKDSRIKVIHKEKNEGLGFARNTGLEIATGEYVAFVDSDDFVDLEMYETLYNKAVGENADAVYCNCTFWKDERHQDIRKDVDRETIFDGKEEVTSFLLDIVGPEPSYKHDVKYMMSVWHAVYRREIFEKHNIRFVSERNFISEDLIFDIDYLAVSNKVIYLPDSFYFYCDNGSSLSRKVDKTRYDRNKKFIEELRLHLSKIFNEDVYKIHFFRQKFLRLRLMLKLFIEQPQMGNLNEVLNDSFWNDVLCEYPYNEMDLKHYLFFICMKNKIGFLLKIML